MIIGIALTIRIDEANGQRADLRVAFQVSQWRDKRVLAHDRVRIEKEQVVAARDGRTAVIGCRESQIRFTSDHRRLGVLFDHHADAAIQRGIVDDDDFHAPRRGYGRVERGQTVIQQLTGVVRHHDDGQFHARDSIRFPESYPSFTQRPNGGTLTVRYLTINSWVEPDCRQTR